MSGQENRCATARSPGHCLKVGLGHLLCKAGRRAVYKSKIGWRFRLFVSEKAVLPCTVSYNFLEGNRTRVTQEFATCCDMMYALKSELGGKKEYNHYTFTMEIRAEIDDLY